MQNMNVGQCVITVHLLIQELVPALLDTRVLLKGPSFHAESELDAKYECRSTRNHCTFTDSRACSCSI